MDFFHENWQWLITAVVLPALAWLALKVKRAWKFAKGLVADVKQLKQDREDLKQCVMDRFDKLETKIDDQSTEHGELKELVIEIKTNQKWLMDKQGD